jgi:transcriptional regulator with XRE-family HTH domain
VIAAIFPIPELKMNAAFLISHISSNQGLTQEQIAQRADAQPDHIAAWSRGEDCPPEKHEVLRKIAGPTYRDPKDESDSTGE